MILFGQAAYADEFDKFERKLAAQRLECYYAPAAYPGAEEGQPMRWVYDGETFSMNGNALKNNTYRSRGEKFIVDLGKLISKKELSVPTKGVPLLFQLKYYVDFQKGVSMLSIGDQINIQGRCRAF